MAKRDFITLKEYSPEEIRQILDLAKAMKANPREYRTALEGMELALLFQKTSTRTRVSFEVAIHQLGGHALYLDWRTTNFTLGDLRDEIKCMSRYVNAIMARVYEHREVEIMAESATVPVINGLSDTSHPCQALADIFTIYEKLGPSFKGKVVFIGDGGNNVATSLLIICAKLGIPMVVVSPKEYSPSEKIMAWVKENKYTFLISVSHDPIEGVKDADVLYTDTFVSMGQENESAKRLQIFKPFQLNDDIVKATKKKPVIMHCLPAHRDVEITSSVLDSPKSVVFDQAENRLHTQKALLLFLLTPEKVSTYLDQLPAKPKARF